MPNIFLIANNPKVDKKIFRYLRKVRAKVIQFNHCALVKYIQPNIVFVRATRKKNLYHGMLSGRKRHVKSKLFKKNPEIIFMDNYPNFKRFAARQPNNYRFTRFKRYVKHYPGKYPSSGYVGIHYILKHFPEYKIYLIGYTFRAPYHNEKFEKKDTLKMVKNRKNGLKGRINNLRDVKRFFPHLFNRRKNNKRIKKR